MQAQVRAGAGLRFADEPIAEPPLAPWKILIADDEEEVHRVTKLALADFSHFGRRLAFLDAYSGAEAVVTVGEQPDIALVLMDVVMESEHAGLEAVLAIRNGLRNRLTRIVIRTGQPGRAPEALVVGQYDVSDYKEKTEVTARKLHTLVHSGLSLYGELAGLTRRKEGLEQLIGASAMLQVQRSEESFARRGLQQLAMMLYTDSARMPSDMLLTVRTHGGGSRVLAGMGYYESCVGRRVDEALSPQVFLEADAAVKERGIVLTDDYFVATAPVAGGGQLMAYIAGAEPSRTADLMHVELFCRSLAAGFDNLRLQRELKESQRSLVLLLATAIEQRLYAGGGHGQRVAGYARLLGELLALPDDVLDWLPLAATLHDVGLIAIPEAILNKRTARASDEQALYETHTRWGQDLLSSQDSEILQMAGLIAAQHHERWDGAGYPDGVAGAQIHLYARITALADALDELLHGPDPLAATEAIGQIERDSGTRFDPQLVTLLVRHEDRFRALGGSD
jgi:HD-GYP domain-containing protein (c-di-GMP phosphodiesterase class II)